MKLVSVTNRDKRNMATLRINNDVMLKNYDVSVFFPSYGQFSVI